MPRRSERKLHRGCLVESDVRGQSDDPIGGHFDVFGICALLVYAEEPRIGAEGVFTACTEGAATAMRLVENRNPVASTQFRDAGSNFGDLAGGLEAECVRRFDR